MACAVAKSVLEVIEEERLQQNAAKIGAHFRKELQRIDSPLIGDVRGQGLMIGVELVDEASAGANIVPLDEARMGAIFEAIKDRGVLLGRGRQSI